MKSRVFIIISLLLVGIPSQACWVDNPTSVDNMIYRIVEDVSPYYQYETSAPLMRSVQYKEEDNLALWRKQTSSKISDASLRWFVYGSSFSDLQKKKEQAVQIFGQDGYRLLLIAKQCEKFREYVNNPWYYPCAEDEKVKNLQKYLKESKSYRGRYASRYALQTLRMFDALDKYTDAVTYWESYAKNIKHDLIKDMAERQVARAYLFTGDTLKAAKTYAKFGDLSSLSMCGLDEEKLWNVIYENCPNSSFFKDELQYLLTHLDNGYLDKMKKKDFTLNSEMEAERQKIHCVLKLANRIIRERKVKDLAMWYYTKAALLDILGRKSEALATIRKGMPVCKKGTFIKNSMRVLRIKIDAETCTFNAAYERKLYRDLKWLDSMGRKHLTPEIWKEDYVGRYYSTESEIYTNRFYWNDVMNRILVNVLVPRLMASGHQIDALLYSNLGVFWIAKNVYGKAEIPNTLGIYTTTNLSNEMMEVANSCSARTIAKMYQRILHPQKGIDRLVVKYGKVDKSYWHDIIGTHYIAEHNYRKAVKWLKGVSRSYQKEISTSEYFDRDPFCLGWGAERDQKFLKSRYNYKLNFAKEMDSLERTMRTAKSRDKRGEAMIRYGIGLRNQKQWCWALSRYYDTSNFYYIKNNDSDYFCEGVDGGYIDISDSKKMIDKGIATLRSRELKAYYLHLFVRNKEVMKYYGDTRMAQQLRRHCDLWRDYKVHRGGVLAR